jgi:hypothetical protein
LPETLKHADRLGNPYGKKKIILQQTYVSAWRLEATGNYSHPAKE